MGGKTLRETTVEAMPTNCGAIDRILKGGVPRGCATLVYGPFKTGKTTLAMQCAVVCARKGMKTLFIDADNSFSTTRLLQIAGYDINSVAPLIVLFKPKSFQEQNTIIENLESFMSKKVVLIVVDTVTSLYRVELGGVEKTFTLNRVLNRQLAYLVKIAKESRVALLLTSQVHSVLGNEGVGRIEPVAERVLKFWSQNILRLEHSENTHLREAFLEKNLGIRSTDIHILFALTNGGVTDVKR